MVFIDLIFIHLTIFFLQAILAKLKSLQLDDYVKNNAHVNTFIRKELGLAFLPEGYIRPAFEQLLETLNAGTRRRLQRFIQYYRNFWIDRVTPAGFSVFGVAYRTNNAIESYHSRLLHRLGFTQLHGISFASTQNLFFLQLLHLLIKYFQCFNILFLYEFKQIEIYHAALLE